MDAAIAQILLIAQVGDYAVGGLIGLAVGGVALYLFQRITGQSRVASAQRRAKQLLDEARSESEVVRKKAEIEAKEEVLKGQELLRKEAEQTRAELKDAERRLAKREDNLEAKLETLDVKERNLEQAQKQLTARNEALGRREEELTGLIEQQRERLLRLSGLSADQARQAVLDTVRGELEHECAEMTSRMLADAKERAVEKAREITLTAIQRYAAEHTSDSTVSTVDIPNDEMKGRVIGREGRNIRAFERATGVTVIVDDTPGVVLVSAFDPVRKEIARLSLERLIQDGRIHPARIEELVEQVREEVDEDVMEAGKAAAVETGVGGLQRKQIELLGRLKYRTSYGQNVLRHSVEVAFLCQIIADELGLDSRLARRCGLLHDIGKAIDHEAEGSHPKIGAEFCRKFRERPEVLNAIEGHHGDVPVTSPYTVIVMAADAISASRPGSRRESLERYIQRLQQLEEIAKVHPGVREAYAIQAGREIRVIVDPRSVDDDVATKIALDIAKQVEEQMTYPGEIKVTVLRETRAIAVAR